MEQIPSFNALIEKSIIDNWDLDSLTDYKGKTLQYHDVARKIEKLHIMFEASGVQRGDKIALCGRNSAAWAAAFLAILTYGAVAVPILHEFTPDQVHNIVNHSDAKLLFIGDVAATQIDATKMPGLEGIIYIPDYSLVVSRTEQLTYAREHLNEMFGKKYPKYFRQQHVHYYREQSPDELALINYTSGTTGFSKGVMLPYRALWSNLDFTMRSLGANMAPGSNVLCTLPMAHMYGMAFEFIFEFMGGIHIHFLTRVPSPKIVFQAFAEIKPSIVISVPLIVEKIIKKSVLPKLQTVSMKLLLRLPVINTRIREKIREKLTEAFGGNFYEIIIGGAAFNSEIEMFLHKIGFNFTVGYGSTECAPIISYSDWHDFRPGSCGVAAPRMEVKIDSPDPANVAGEILARGMNVMLGYYKNEAATAEAITDGYFHTGDIGKLGHDGFLFITGRMKNVIILQNGKNVYPEEIEDKLSAMCEYIGEIIIFASKKDENGDQTVLGAEIFPDAERAAARGISDVQEVIKKAISDYNEKEPSYKVIKNIVFRTEEFEKTTSKKIKRKYD